MPVYEAPPDDGDHAPRQSYNFCPGYHGIVYRADTNDWGAGPQGHTHGDAQLDDVETASSGITEDEQSETRYKLQSMTWGLVPFWTKRNPDYASKMKTINCRADSLKNNTGLWTSMKQKKRCVVVVQGFFEWLKSGKEKIPHFVKRRDGKLMCFAGLWDCVQYDGLSTRGFEYIDLAKVCLGQEDKHFTYTVITTDSNKQLKFLHDRMPVILENGSKDLRTWLNPGQLTWSKNLQNLLKPFEGELDVYPVKKDVGKVGNNSPDFIIPITELKSNIENFFARGSPDKSAKASESGVDATKVGPRGMQSPVKDEDGNDRETIDHEGTEDNAPLPVPSGTKAGIKRELDDVDDSDDLKRPNKISRIPALSQDSSPVQPVRKTRSATSNNSKSPAKPASKTEGSQKITSFFKK